MKKGLKCGIVVVILMFISTLAMAAKLSTGTESTMKKLELQEIWYKVIKGDNLYRIAVNHGTSVQDIKFYNKGARGKYIHPGQEFRIVVPIIHQKTVLLKKKPKKIVKKVQSPKKVVKVAKIATVKSQKKKTLAKNDDKKGEPSKVVKKKLAKKNPVKTIKKNAGKSLEKNQKRYYIVKSGDVLGGISKKINVSMRDLRLWNRLDKRSTIRIGQKLSITKPRFYVVVKGDSLSRISGKTDISIAMLRYYNKKLPRVIHPGDIMFLDKDVFIPHSLKSQERRIGTRRMKRYAQYIDLAYQKYGVDRNLISAVMKVESNFNPKVRSTAGAYGLMQLMAETAQDMKVNRYNELQNVMGGAKYLALVNEMFNGSLDKTLAAYNAGPGAVKKYMKKYKGIPPYKETKEYIAKVKATYRKSVRYMLET